MNDETVHNGTCMSETIRLSLVGELRFVSDSVCEFYRLLHSVTAVNLRYPALNDAVSAKKRQNAIGCRLVIPRYRLGVLTLQSHAMPSVDVCKLIPDLEIL